MKNMIIVDTGYWLALRNEHDKFHKRAIACLNKYKNERFITTWPVMTETFYLLSRRVGYEDAIAFLRAYKAQAFSVFNIESQNAERLIEMCNKYKDLPMDLADASLVLLAEHLGHGKILSTDVRDFNTYRWKQRKPFKNLMA